MKLKPDTAFEEYKKIIEASGLFDNKFYLKNNHDARVSSEISIDHFVKYGLNEDRKPNEEFDPIWYRNYYEDIKENKFNPFIHYILHGKMEKRYENEGKREVSVDEIKSSPNLDPECIYQLANDNLDTIRQGRIRFHPIFPVYNEESYLEQNEDIRKAVDEKVYKTGFDHFLAQGYNEILSGKRNYRELR